MQNNEERTDNQTRISELAQAIEELSAELNRRLAIENTNDPPPVDIVVPPVAIPVVIPQPEVALATEIRDFVVGDLVEITNNHRNLQGHQGYVIRLTRRQVIIRLLNSSNQVVRKSKTSVRLIQQHNE